MAVSPLPPVNGQYEQLIQQISQLTRLTIGRSADNSIVISNSRISGHHARLIQCTLHSFVLEDLDSRNGTFVNGARVTRKVVGSQDSIRLADAEYTVQELLNLPGANTPVPVSPPAAPPADSLPPVAPLSKERPDCTEEFAALRQVFEQYPNLRRACRNREKMIRMGSVLLSSVVGVSAALATGGGTVLLHVLSGAGLSILVPTLSSTFLSTDEKLEIIDREYRERYRCPNCRDPFGSREWEQLAQQKTCRRCEAVWVN